MNHTLPILSFILLLAQPGIAQAVEPVEEAKIDFTLTGIPTFDPVYMELQVIKQDILRAENQVSHAHTLILGALDAAENMSLEKAIRAHKAQAPTAPANTEKIALARTELDGAKTTLAQVPERYNALHQELVRVQEQAPEAGRAAGMNTRARLNLVKTVESNQLAASQLPFRATEGVKQANLMLSHMQELGD